MSVDYSLHAGVSWTEDEVIRHFKAGLGLQMDTAPNQFFGPGLTVSIRHGLTADSDVATLFGLESEVKVYFMPYDYREGDDEGAYWKVYIDMISTCASFLHEADVDGVLTREDEDILLQRRGGQVTLNSNYGNWHVIEPGRNLHVPFEFAPLPPVYG